MSKNASSAAAVAAATNAAAAAAVAAAGAALADEAGAAAAVGGDVRLTVAGSGWAPDAPARAGGAGLRDPNRPRSVAFKPGADGPGGAGGAAGARSAPSARSAGAGAGGAGGSRRMITRSVSTLGAPEAGKSHWIWGVGHIICANVGAGVLALPNAVAWLGWVGGPLAIVALTWVAMFCGELLTHAYRAKGRRRATYKDAVMAQLGPRYSSAIVGILYLRYFLVTIGYTVIAATGMLYIAKWACAARGVEPGPWAQLWVMALAFSCFQLFLSQLPDLEHASGCSALGACMSITYTGIALALCFASIGNRGGSVAGRPKPPMDKIFGIFNAIGTILFANASAVLVLDIQHTVREPPANDQTMRKVVRISFTVGMVLYTLTGLTGYLAIGDSVGSDILVEFENDSRLPTVVPLLANIFTFMHFVPAYQVFAQPLFVVLEQGILAVRPGLALGPEWPVRLVYRTIYVCITAALASTLPFFGAISGLIGAIAFWPTVVAGPILMYLSSVRPRRAEAAALHALMWGMLAVALCALVGSVYSFAKAATAFRLFGGVGPHR